MIRDNFAKNTLAPLTLRLALAAVFIYHGVDKIAGKRSGLGTTWATSYWQERSMVPPELAEKLERLSRQEQNPEKKERIQEIRDGLKELYGREQQLPPGALQYYAAQLAVAWGELIAGILLLIGFGTRLAAAGLIVIQLGAIFTVTWEQGFSVAEGGGYEYNLVLLAACLALLFLGGGPLSVGRALARRKRPIPPAATPTEPVSV